MNAKNNQLNKRVIIIVILFMILLIVNLVVIIYSLESDSKINNNSKSKINYLQVSDNVYNFSKVVTIDFSNPSDTQNNNKYNRNDYNNLNQGHHYNNPNPTPIPTEPDRSWISNNTITEPTNQWMDIYGNITIEGKPAEIGDKIAAFDTNGNLIGIYVIKNPGKFGFMHIYSYKGEYFKERLNFLVYDKNTDKVKKASSDVVYFNTYDKKNIDLYV